MFWLNLLIFLMLIAGHTELMVMIINRLHGQRIHSRTLRHMRHLHDLMIPLFPVGLVWFVGIRGPSVLVGGSWRNLTGGWGVFLAFCAVGFLGLSYSIIRTHLYRLPHALISNHSRTVDLIERLGYIPVKPGPYRSFVHFPFNQIFQVEVSEKIYQLPRLPKEWDGLSILHLTDFHFTGTIDRPFFEEVIKLSQEMEPDLIVFTGDLLDQQQLLEWLPETLGQLKAPLGQFFILGNHDWYLDPEKIRAELALLGWTDVAGKTINLDHKGKELIIGGTEYPWMGEHPDWGQPSDDAFRLLLSHSPDNLAWAREQQVDLMLSGHNHGGQVVLPLIGPVYSPSRFGVQYAGGAYWEEPTMLYVSRGISGLHPLRIRCKPELTKLVLRSEG